MFNRIEELDLHQVTLDIKDFYSEHGEPASYDQVYHFVNQWSVLKYDLYKKMGFKLVVSSEASGNIGLSPTTLDTRIGEFGEKKGLRKNAHVSDVDPLEKGSEERMMTQFLRMSASLIGTNVDPVKNYFGGGIHGLHSLAYFIANVTGEKAVDDLFLKCTDSKDTLKIMSQKKLTKAIAACFKHPAVILKYGKEESKRVSTFLINLISEVKQYCQSGSEDTEVYISIHPYDFVTMSYNQSRWSSCYSPSGEYSKSPLIVMADASTAIAFSKGSESEHHCPVLMNNKKVRSMVHFNNLIDSVIINKTYPSSFGGYHDLVLDTIAKTGLISNPVRREIQIDFVWDDHPVEVSPAMYNDLGSLISDTETLEIFSVEDYDPDSHWYIGVEGDICMDCGGSVGEEDYDGESYHWYCEDCREYNY